MSVVIPCFNYGRYLAAAIDSALAQAGAQIEVIVVDDASTDDSAAVATAYGEHVRLVRHTRNSGPVATFNDGLAVATGEYLVRLDADDILTPGSVARAVALAEAEPSVGLVYGRPVHFAGDRPSTHRAHATRWRITDGPAWLDLRCESGVNCITSPEALMRMSVVAEVGGQRQLAHTHDMEMWMRIARVSDVGWIDGADQAWHREHPASLSATDTDVIGDLEERLAAFEVLLTDGLGDSVADAARLAVARRTLAIEALRRAIAACVRGRGTQAEIVDYQRFVDASGADLTGVREVRLLARALRLGSGAGRSPALVAWAVGNRLRAARARRHWEKTGL
ncbi:glycosyltransferase family 2 protein [Agromyces intestinalis]|uniref:glycosyltransferase family 2 protein n=1 Tax=Agromyces intestinalis TaxID=2592652 RepID=UPI00143CC375|nr:glycosyltransferase family 2 protein [Agromyces intestinalis]